MNTPITISLPPSLYTCPQYWQNFIRRVVIPHQVENNISYSSPELVTQLLTDYHGHFVEVRHPGESPYGDSPGEPPWWQSAKVTFLSYDDYLLFLLRFG